jgi:Protein of unknown function (DUF2786)
MADRNAIIEKIKALLAKTTANGATEAEMLSALDKASAMMDAYDISDADVQDAKDEAAMLHADPPDLKDPHKIKWRLSHAVGEFCGVRVYRSRRETGLRCIGRGGNSCARPTPQSAFRPPKNARPTTAA